MMPRVENHFLTWASPSLKPWARHNGPETRLTDWALRTYQTFRRQKKEMARVMYSASLMQAEFPTETRHRHGHRKREAMRAASILLCDYGMLRAAHADFVPIELDLRRTAYEHSSRFRRYHTPDGYHQDISVNLDCVPLHGFKIQGRDVTVFQSYVIRVALMGTILPPFCPEDPPSPSSPVLPFSSGVVDKSGVVSLPRNGYPPTTPAPKPQRAFASVLKGPGSFSAPLVASHRARSEQRGPQGHTGLARTSSESHRMGTERRHLDYKGKKSNTTRPRAFPPPNPIHDLANQIATAPSRRKPRRQVDFQPAGTPLDCARLREGGMVAVCRNRVSKA
ncbi:hypothetical protein V496_03545 [Pseudogymnoascus sp. VKM F-4515 (FW-2607)]|nr:hypothetical protein V496_03545 [Pseudogymnoascus sp. VKM F-4515 (FW-2607)]